MSAQEDNVGSETTVDADSETEPEETATTNETTRKRSRESSPSPPRKKRRLEEEELEKPVQIPILPDSAKSTPKSTDKVSKDLVKILSSEDEETEPESEDLDEGIQMHDQTKKKRKRIRKIKEKQTDKEIEAQKREEERKKRLEDRKSQKSETSSESSDPLVEPDNRSSVCLNPDGDGQKIYASDSVGSKLQEHQLEGIRFMFDNVVETVERARDPKNEGFGCILAHFMGLGKTLQCITLIEAYLSYKIGKHVLVVVPVNVIHNWNQEFEKWIPEDERPGVTVVYKSSYKERVNALRKWDKKGGVLIIGYEMFRNLIKSKRVPEKLQKQAAQYLTETPSLLIIDEGHRIKNVKTGLSKVLNSVNTKRRIVLTGTPLQNNLTEYYCMVNFVRQDILGSEVTFNNRFKNPITNGQCSDSSDGDIKLMKERVYILHKKLVGFVHRRDYSHMKMLLPTKSEFVLFCRLCPIQRELYKKYLTSLKSEPAGLFQSYHWLNKVWNHPDSLLHYERDEEERMGEVEDSDDSTGSLIDFVAEDGAMDSEETRPESDSDIELIEEAKKPSKKRKKKDDGGRQAKRRKTNWWGDIVNEDKGYEECNLENSSKTMIAFRVCELAVKRKEKVLLFSQSLFLLDLMEEIFQQKKKWKLGKHYMRLDGGTASKQRQEDIDYFNSRPKAKPWVYLISTKAGSLGVNLHSANKVIVFDCSWNPSHDTQAIFRSYRQGQKNNVTIYRLVAAGTMEQKIYQRQLVKKSLSLRVVDEKQIERLFDKQEVNQLYKLEEENEDEDGDILMPVQASKKCKDEVMIQLLKDYGSAQCLEYLEENVKKCSKQRLLKDIEIPEDRLQHQTDLELNKEEQLQAEENFKNSLRMEASHSHMPHLDAQSGLLHRGDGYYIGRHPQVGGGSGLTEIFERVKCALCNKKTEVRITENTNRETKFQCKACTAVFTLALADTDMDRLRGRLQKKKQTENILIQKEQEIMRLNDPTVYQELHQAMDRFTHMEKEEVLAHCPSCKKTNQFRVGCGSWNISCGECKQKFKVEVPQSQKMKIAGRRRAIIDVHNRFVLKKRPVCVDLTADAVDLTKPVDLTNDSEPVDLTTERSGTISFNTEKRIVDRSPVDLTQDSSLGIPSNRRLDILPPSLEICENSGSMDLTGSDQTYANLQNAQANNQSGNLLRHDYAGNGSKEDAIVLD